MIEITFQITWLSWWVLGMIGIASFCIIFWSLERLQLDGIFYGRIGFSMWLISNIYLWHL